MPKISVIVPVYNVEEYLDECIQSIVNQTLQDLEIILVDDGSPDNCPQICDDWAKKDNRIKVIHKQNGGVSSAILMGINIANADFIGFVDSDDFIESDFYSVLYENLIKFDVDCVSCNYMFSNGGLKSKAFSNDETIFYNKKEIEEKMLTSFFENGTGLYENWSISRCNKLYKTDLFKKILSITNLKPSIGEDMYLNFLYLNECKSVLRVYDYAGYIYRQNNSSISHLYKDTLLEDNLRYINSIKEVATIQNRDFAFYQQFHDSVLNRLLWLAIDSDNSINYKIKSCKAIKSAMIKSNNFLDHNLKDFHILVKLGFYLIQSGLISLGVAYIHVLLKIRKLKIFNKCID